MNHYQVLGVEETASQETIKSARLKKAKEFHPDTHPGDPALEEKMKRINEAYEVLGDEERRKKYDAKLAKERAVKKESAVPKPTGNPATASWEQVRKSWQAQAARSPKPTQPPVAAQGGPVWRKPLVVPAMVARPATKARSSDSGWDLDTLLKVLGTAGAAFLTYKVIRNSGSRWDPTVQRRRGPDGRFRSS
ncbi:J domain-containing protein [Hyalangium minutum]|uniref:DnaJ-class molecular chaperone CbpA n=1 Tax=Hyalangium minutum TaxID=394096 RepID=A0A085WLM3_9BACT|nr:J domain-containing protein [Hyalangium minutum]KFE68586.1 DnaJ-class molecular chaperone CbpA [Hyalangium minutum]